MKREELIRMIRLYLYDREEKIFKDRELSDYLDKAAEAYSKDTELYRSGFYFCADADGRCELPQDYIKMLSGWGKSYQIEKITPDKLQRYYSDYRAMKGLPEFVYEETEDAGVVRLCPNPHEIQDVTSWVMKGYGVPVFGGNGIYRRSKSYGIPLRVKSFQKAGDCWYVRKEDCEKIFDYTALVYHVLSQAYLGENDFHDEEKSENYRKMYQMRIGRTNHPNKGLGMRSGYFY